MTLGWNCGRVEGLPFPHLSLYIYLYIYLYLYLYLSVCLPLLHAPFLLDIYFELKICTLSPQNQRLYEDHPQVTSDKQPAARGYSSECSAVEVLR